MARLVHNGANHIFNSLVALLAVVGKLPLTCGGSVRRSGRTVFSTFSAIGVYLAAFVPVLSAVATLPRGVHGTTTNKFVGTASYTSCLINGKLPFHSTCGTANRVITLYVGGKLVLRALPLRRCGGVYSLFSSNICSTVGLSGYMGNEASLNKPTPRGILGRTGEVRGVLGRRSG